MNVSSEVCLICRAIWVSFLHKHASVYLRFSDTGLCWLSIQHNTMTNGHLLLRQIRLRESVFVSFLLFFTAHNSPWLPTHPVFWFVFLPNYRRAQNRNVLWMSPPHILVDRFRRTSIALSVLPALCVKKCHPFSDPVPPPPKDSCCFISALLYSPCCNQAEIYMSGVRTKRQLFKSIILF